MPDITPALFASLAAALCFYLAAPRQQWLARPLGRPWRFLGGLLLAAAWLLWHRLMHGAAAFFVLLAILMLLFALLPVLSLLKPKFARRKA